MNQRGSSTASEKVSTRLDPVDLSSGKTSALVIRGLLKAASASSSDDLSLAAVPGAQEIASARSDSR
jgi:hypothetical protein